MNARINLSDLQAVFGPLEDMEREARERYDNDVRSIQDEFKRRGVDAWEASTDYRQQVCQRYRLYEREIWATLDEPMVGLCSPAGGR